MGRPIGLECSRCGARNALIDYAEDCAPWLTIPAATPAGAYVVLASAAPITVTSPRDGSRIWSVNATKRSDTKLESLLFLTHRLA